MTKIYYFSGTGNSLWSAKKIAQITGGTLYNIGLEARKEPIIIEADVVVMVFPSYAYGLPLIVRRFVKAAVFKTPYLAALVTYGSNPRGTPGALQRLLKKKGIAKMYFGRIRAAENYLAIFRPFQTRGALENRLSMQEIATEEAARAIMERRENRVSAFYPYSAVVSWLFSLGVTFFFRRYRLSEGCNGCGTCAKICPVSAIEMRDGRPFFTSRCENCMGCINLCPSRAIQFGRVKWGSQGYRHPRITINELGVNH